MLEGNGSSGSNMSNGLKIVQKICDIIFLSDYKSYESKFGEARWGLDDNLRSSLLKILG